MSGRQNESDGWIRRLVFVLLQAEIGPLIAIHTRLLRWLDGEVRRWGRGERRERECVCVCVCACVCESDRERKRDRQTERERLQRFYDSRKKVQFKIGY